MKKGDRVLIRTELGFEPATVISISEFDPMITVRFDDGTESSWPREVVEPVTDEPAVGVLCRLPRPWWEG